MRLSRAQRKGSTLPQPHSPSAPYPPVAAAANTPTPRHTDPEARWHPLVPWPLAALTEERHRTMTAKVDIVRSSDLEPDPDPHSPHPTGPQAHKPTAHSPQPIAHRVPAHLRTPSWRTAAAHCTPLRWRRPCALCAPVAASTTQDAQANHSLDPPQVLHPPTSHLCECLGHHSRGYTKQTHALCACMSTDCISTTPATRPPPPTGDARTYTVLGGRRSCSTALVRRRHRAFMRTRSLASPSPSP